MKRFLTVALAFALGVLLFLAVTPYARAHRADPSKVGGEILLPAFPVLVCLRVFDIKRTRAEYRRLREQEGEGDDE